MQSEEVLRSELQAGPLPAKSVVPDRNPTFCYSGLVLPYLAYVLILDLAL